MHAAFGFGTLPGETPGAADESWGAPAGAHVCIALVCVRGGERGRRGPH